MATGNNAAAPDSPVGSSPLRKGSMPALAGWFKEVSDFLRSLSPSGAATFAERVDISITDTRNFDYFSGNAKFGADRLGKSVVLYGDLLCTSSAAISGVEGAQFGQLPEGFRPIYQRRQLAQGYDTGTVMITVNVDGSIKASRYTGPSVNSIWIPVDLTFHTA